MAAGKPMEKAEYSRNLLLPPPLPKPWARAMLLLDTDRHTWIMVAEMLKRMFRNMRFII